MQLADSFFPSGTFGLSGGMESHVRSGRVKNANQVIRLIRQQIKFQVIPFDCAILLNAMKEARRGHIHGLAKADIRCHSMKLVGEVRTASTRSGKQVIRTLLGIKNHTVAKKFQAMINRGECPGTYPVCLAITACALAIPEASAVRMLLYSYSTGLIGSAIRMGVISHIEGQKILTEIAKDVNAAKPAAGLEELWQLGPLAEILQMRHELDEFRMFIT